MTTQMKKMNKLCFPNILMLLLSNLAFGNCMFCNDSLGLESGKIEDSQITAKNSGGGTKPHDVRYNNSMSWCVNNYGSTPKFYNDYYLQIDLLDIHKVSGILLQAGRKGFSYGPKIKLEYKMRALDPYVGYKILKTSSLSNQNTEYIKIEPPIHARFIKYLPVMDENPKCVRIELLGCSMQVCNQSLLKESMEYSESSYHSSRTGSKFTGKYIAATVTGFAWGPDGRKSITNPYQEYVQVNLKNSYIINAVEVTRPMYAKQQLRMPKAFIVLYKNGSRPWSNVTRFDNQVIEFNTLSSLGTIVKIKPAFHATQIQIRPKIENGVQIYMKIQFFGCLYKDAFKPKPTAVSPATTKITHRAGHTTGATKSLKTSQAAPRDPAVIKYYEIRQGDRYKDVSYVGKSTKDVLHDGKGVLVDGVRGGQTPFRPSLWVGWRKKLLPTPYITIILEKSALFKSLELVSYVNSEQKISLFASCTIQFSKNEMDQWSKGYYVCPRRESKTGVITSRINLMGKIAARMRMTFNYSDEWLLLSEITLNTNFMKAKALNISETFCNISSPTVKVIAPEPNSTLMIVLIVIPVLLVLVILIVIVYKYRKKIQFWILVAKVDKRVERDEPFVSYTRDGTGEHMYAEVKDDTDRDRKKAFREEKEENANRAASDYDQDDDVMYAAPDQNLLGNQQQSVGYIEVTVEPGRQSPLPNYAEPNTKPDPEPVEMNPIYEGTQIYEDPYQTVTGSSLYADPQMEKDKLSIEVRKFPREKLRFIEKIGEGQFGEVHICEVDALGSLVNTDVNCSWRMNNTVQVAVKLLKSGVDKNVESEFMKEVRVMARLKHENVVQLLGVCDEEPKCMVVEYMENGDLNQFLKNYTAPTASGGNKRTLNVDTLLHICMQMAAGMKYLSSQGFIHRDLATRNCLVGHSFTVKISDFGMSRYLYSKQYYRIEGKAVLPIRWMAPESLFYGTFTSQTDVWAFAVTIWEIFTFARETPYSHLTDQQVIDNACSVVAKQHKAFKCLSRPQGCSAEVYEELLQCWQRSPDDRPCFDELFQFFADLSSTVEGSI